MARFNFLDDIGLRNLVDNIIENFSTKSETEENRKTLSDRIEEVYQYLLKALGDEISRAELSEAELRSFIEQEISRAEASESEISNGLSDEILRAQGREDEIQSSLEEEINRSKTEESSIRDSLSKEVERATSVEDTIKLSLEEEVSRAKGSEESLGNSIKDEVIRATEVEGVLRTAIDEVSSELDEEIQRTDGIEQSLNSLSDNFEEAKEDLSSQIVTLSDRTSILEKQVADGAGAVKDVLVDGVSIVKDRIAYLQKSEISGESNASILTFPDVSYFPTEESEVPPNFTTLYLALDTKILYKWDGESYSELGKSNIVITESLPEVGIEDVLYVLSTNYTIHQWVGNGYKEIGGKDEDLRSQFIVHISSTNPHNVTKEDVGLADVDNTSDLDKPISIATQEALDSLNSNLTGISVSLEEGLTNASEELRTHIRNKENPHNVTAEILGLGMVDNTRDLEKPISYAVQTELDNKVNYEDIKDSLVSTETSKPLSARQGSVLNGKISELSGTILSIGTVFHFKGTLSSVEELETIENPVQGDAWQVRILDESGKDTSGVVYSYTDDNGWVEISASVSDISSYVASTEDVYAIIDAF